MKPIEKYIVYLIPVLLWVGFIYHLSSQPYKQQSINPYLNNHFSADQMARWLPDITIHYRTSVISAKKDPFQFIEFIFRKSAHMFMYGMLSLLLFFSMRYFYRGHWLWKSCLIMLIVALVAILDEWNQTKVGNRTGALEDVGIDLLGALIGLAIALIITSRIKHR